MNGCVPFVSIIVPVYNGEATIVRCVESLLVQDYPSDRREIIIVDNGSKDQTVELLQPYAKAGTIRLLSETKIRNAYGARNSGIRSAHGEILVFTDADCFADGGWLAQVVIEFSKPTIGCVTGDILPATPQNVIEKYWDTNFLGGRTGEGKAMASVRGANCAFRRCVLDEIGLFDDRHPSGGDAELAWRMMQKTDKTVSVNLCAVVRHHNVSSLQAFVKQSMRYGTHMMRTYEDAEVRSESPRLRDVLYLSFVFALSFLKRSLLFLTGHLPPTISSSDRDIYVLRPCLRILNEWGIYLGSKFAVKNPEILR